ncbi:MAG: ATP-binding protein [Candidatus Aenigmarchaeota archaeon]|nr:ATP-binding protein [Candidatus Aenigmarchaeota archaeon]
MPLVKAAIGDQRYLIAQLAQSYRNPVDALKEYVSNSVDNMLEFGLPSIRVLVLFNKDYTQRNGARAPRIIIQDDGTGMMWQTLLHAPEKVGLSNKRDKQMLIGKKAVGLWAYGNFSDSTTMRMYTRPYSRFGEAPEKVYDSVNQKISEQFRSSGLRVTSSKTPDICYYIGEWPSMRDFKNNRDVNIDVVGEGNLEPHVPFKHGVRTVVQGIPDRQMDHLLRNLPKELREMYDPLLRENRAQIFIGTWGGKKQTRLKPLEYNGTVITDETINVPFTDSSGKTQNGTVRCYIVYTPQKAPTAIRVYDRGVLVVQLPQLETDLMGTPLASENVTGFITQNFLTPNINRDSFIRNTEFDGFLDIVDKLKKHVGDELRKYQVVNKTESDKLAELTDTFINSLDTTWKDLRKELFLGGHVLVPGVKEDPILSVSPTGGRGVTRIQGKGNGKTPEQTKGRPTYEQTGDGEYRHIRGGRRLISYVVHRTEFDLQEMHLTSKLDPSQGKVYINTAHTLRKQVERQRDEEGLARFDAHLISHQVAIGEVLKLCETVGEDPTQYLRDFVPHMAIRFYMNGVKAMGIDN